MPPSFPDHSDKEITDRNVINDKKASLLKGGNQDDPTLSTVGSSERATLIYQINSKSGNSNRSTFNPIVAARPHEFMGVNQPPPPPGPFNYQQRPTGNFINHSNNSSSRPLLPVNAPRIMTPNVRPPNASSEISGAVRLIPVMMTRNIVHWLRPIYKHCTLEQFFASVNETIMLETLNIFFVFYYNRPANRVSISMLQLFRLVMEAGGYHQVCNSFFANF